jgi:alanyl-tRNA synthetase
VVPQDDPTLLFTNAGMNQFKDVLLGNGTRPFKRAVNSQKCIRVSGKHNDLEEVGHDTYHHTFFEMLGNWSFGDYYKKEAILWAWELLTEVWKIPREKLYATVFREDDEAAEFWAKETGIPQSRILRFGEKDNFWEMGDTGPCGPCSEIHIDQGVEYCDKPDIAHECSVNGECGRYIELWNLVFVQYNRDTAGELHVLPAKHVDTGAGFERLVAVLQNKNSNYETDLFTPLIEKISEISAVSYGSSEEKSAFHVIADHVRMLSYAIADGGKPGNEGRDYVIRRILRRAARYGRNLNLHQPFIFQLVPTVKAILGEYFPISNDRLDHVKTVIRSEEEHFNRTLDRGLEIFENIKSDLAVKNETVIPGDEVFKLYDTYGFPVDLTRSLALESDLKLDDKGFNERMSDQKARARKAAKFQVSELPGDSWTVLSDTDRSNFVGYTEDAIDTQILRYAIHDRKVHIVLKDTPFYAEAGGQLGDQGTISNNEFDLTVLDAQKNGNYIVHICALPDDFQVKSDKVLAQISTNLRRETEKHHTATHLLHAALRNILGTHVEQAGSLVAPDRLRFDFTHYSKVEHEQILKIEDQVNSKIQEDITLEIAQDNFEEAKAKGAMALFGEKYGDMVRTVRVPDFSFELCGGTHVNRTGQIGAFAIIYEGSIAAGIRRIEAITGKTAVQYFQNVRDQINEISEIVSSGELTLAEKIRDLVDSKKEIEKELNKISVQLLSEEIDEILAQKEKIKGIDVIIYPIENAGIDQLKDVGDQIRNKSINTIAVLGTIADNKINFVCVVSDDLIKEKGFRAGDLVKKIAQVAGGGGGGRPHMATAGAKDISKFSLAMSEIKNLI